METSIDSCRSVHLKPGRMNRVAVVFSCPGRHEEAAGCPAARNTGKNLDLLLSLLGEELGRGDLNRENITITNAWAGVEYREKTGRSEASEREVISPENVERLSRELEEITELVIFCGGRARAVARLLRLKHRPRFVFIRHPGLRGLSLIRADVEGSAIVAANRCQAAASGGKKALQAQNTRRRLAVLARSIGEQLRSVDEGGAPLPPVTSGKSRPL